MSSQIVYHKKREKLFPFKKIEKTKKSGYKNVKHSEDTTCLLYSRGSVAKIVNINLF